MDIRSLIKNLTPLQIALNILLGFAVWGVAWLGVVGLAVLSEVVK